MAERSTNLLNKTITLTLNSVGVPDTLSVRLTGCDPEMCIEIDGLAWGIQEAGEADLTDFDFGPLFVIENDIFDAAFTYTNANVHAAAKGVVFQDSIVRPARFAGRRFKDPVKLKGYSNYLIVMNAPTAIGVPGAAYTSVLTAHGRQIKSKLRAAL